MLSTPLYLVSDDQATTTGLASLKKNIDVQGPGKIIMTNNSNAVSGLSTNFTDASPAGMSFWFSFWVKDSANNWYHCFIGNGSVNSATSLTIGSSARTYGRSLIRGGYMGVNNDGIGNIYTGVTGTYDYWILRNWSDGLLSNSDGNNSYADNFGTAIGGHATVIGQTGFASGFYAYVSGIQGTALGRFVRSTGNEALVGGKGVGTNKAVLSAGQTSFNYSEVNSSQSAGEGALAANSAILGGVNQNIPSNSTRSAIIGGNTIKATSATTDTVFMPRVRIGQGTGGSVVTNNLGTNLIGRNTSTGELENMVLTGVTTVSRLILSGSTTPFILDNQATVQNVFAYRSNVDVKGPGQIIMTNGSSIVSGISTTFTDATTGLGLSYWFCFWVKDSAGNWYFNQIASVTNSTRLVNSRSMSRAQIRLGATNQSANASIPVVSPNFSGVTGTYDYWMVRNWSDGLYSVALGNTAYADNFSLAFGGGSTAIGQASIAMGQQNFASATNGIAIGTQNRSTIGTGTVAIGYRCESSGTFGSVAMGVSAQATASGAVAIGRGFDAAGSASDKYLIAGAQGAFISSENNISQTAGHGALAQGSAILGGLNHNIPTGSTRSAIIGGNTIKATSATTDTVFMPRLRIGQGISGALVTGTSTNILTRNVTTGEVEALVTSDLSKINAGINWTNRTTPIDFVWFTSVYGNGTFAVISTSTNIITSQDGVVWSGRTAASSATWSGSAYGKGLFVAVATNGAPNQVMTSPDGITWTSRTAAANKGWINLAYGNGLFVAVSNTLTGTTANRIMASYDGISWTGRTSPGNTPWKSITYGNGLFVAVSQSTSGTTANKVMYSRDSISWTYTSSAENNQWNSVCYGNGLFVAVANAGTNRVMTSPNGITWTTAVAAAANAWQSVGYGNGLFVAVSNTGTLNRVMTSPDGITWTTRSNPIDNNWLTTIFGNGVWVAASNTGTLNRVMTSGKQYEVLNISNSYWNLGGNSTITSPVNIIGTSANTITFQINIEYNASGYVSALHSLTDKQYVTGTTYLNTGVTTNIKISTVGKGLYIKEGANATMGVKTLTGGTAVVATTKVTATSRIQLTSQSDGGTPGWLRVSARSAGTSFTITSSSGTDTSVIAWLIIEPA